MLFRSRLSALVAIGGLTRVDEWSLLSKGHGDLWLHAFPSMAERQMYITDIRARRRVCCYCNMLCGTHGMADPLIPRGIEFEMDVIALSAAT